MQPDAAAASSVLAGAGPHHLCTAPETSSPAVQPADDGTHSAAQQQQQLPFDSIYPTRLPSISVSEVTDAPSERESYLEPAPVHHSANPPTAHNTDVIPTSAADAAAHASTGVAPAAASSEPDEPEQLTMVKPDVATSIRTLSASMSQERSGSGSTGPDVAHRRSGSAGISGSGASTVNTAPGKLADALLGGLHFGSDSSSSGERPNGSPSSHHGSHDSNMGLQEQPGAAGGSLSLDEEVEPDSAAQGDALPDVNAMLSGLPTANGSVPSSHIQERSTAATAMPSRNALPSALPPMPPRAQLAPLHTPRAQLPPLQGQPGLPSAAPPIRQACAPLCQCLCCKYKLVLRP